MHIAGFSSGFWGERSRVLVWRRAEGLLPRVRSPLFASYTKVFSVDAQRPSTSRCVCRAKSYKHGDNTSQWVLSTPVPSIPDFMSLNTCIQGVVCFLSSGLSHVTASTVVQTLLPGNTSLSPPSSKLGPPRRLFRVGIPGSSLCSKFSQRAGCVHSKSDCQLLMCSRLSRDPVFPWYISSCFS